MREIGRLRYWVQKVLPLVYDDSLSYYELLNKVVWKLNEVIETTNDYYELFGIKIADPINWSIDTQYQQYTIVMDSNGNGYISKQPVPVNVRLDNEDYWTPIFNFGEVLEGVKIGITKYDFGNNPTTDVAISKGSLLYWKDVLYRAMVDMPIGTAFVVGTNIEEADLNDLLTDIIDRADELETNLNAEISARESGDSELETSIDGLNTTVSELNTTISELNSKSNYAQYDPNTDGAQVEVYSNYVRNKGCVYGAKITRNGLFGGDINRIIDVYVPPTSMTAPEVARLNKFRAMIGGPLRGKYVKNGIMYGDNIPEAQYWFGNGSGESGTGAGFGYMRVGQTDDAGVAARYDRFGILIWCPLIFYGSNINIPTTVMDAILTNGKTFRDYIWNGTHPRQVLVYNTNENNTNEFHFLVFSGRECGDVGFTCPEVVEYIRANYYNPRFAVNMDGGGNTTLYTGVSRVQPPQNYENRNTFAYLYASDAPTY